MTAPAEAYYQRAGVAPRPADYVEQRDPFAHTVEDAEAWANGEHPEQRHAAALGLAYAAAPRIYWADISEFQQVITSAYPWQQLAIRLDTGWRLDYHAQANRREWLALKRSGFLMGYVVFIPGQSGAIVRRITNAFGAHLEGLAPMVDMESGSGFAGRGNHSSEANDFVADLAARTGSRAREVGYANGGDWASNWPSRPSWLKRIVANYGSTVVAGCWGQQYHGGGNYPVPAAWPRSVKPFGSYIDLNSAALSTASALTSLGLAPAPSKEFQMTPAEETKIKGMLSELRAQVKADTAASVETYLADALVALRDGGEYGPFTRKRHPVLLKAGQSLKALFGATPPAPPK